MMNAMKGTVLLSALLALGTLAVQAGEMSGEELFKNKCGSCHMTTRPADMSTLVAPPIPGVALHVKNAFPKKQDAVAFIESYALHPSRDRSLCMPAKIKRFGLMPSQQGNVTPEELKKIAEYIVDNYPNADFVRMHQRLEGREMQAGRPISPFLIRQGLPHLSKILMQRWDDPSLGLTNDQKAKLVAIRKETMAGVRTYKPQVMQLERTIRRAILSGGSADALAPNVSKLADLKKDLTMIHLRCIEKTRQVLTPEQFAMIMPGKGGKMGSGNGAKQGGKSQGGCTRKP